MNEITRLHGQNKNGLFSLSNHLVYFINCVYECWLSVHCGQGNGVMISLIEFSVNTARKYSYECVHSIGIFGQLSLKRTCYPRHFNLCEWENVNVLPSEEKCRKLSVQHKICIIDYRIFFIAIRDLFIAIIYVLNGQNTVGLWQLIKWKLKLLRRVTLPKCHSQTALAVSTHHWH